MSASGIPVWARLSLVCCGGLVVVWLCKALAGKYLLDDPAFVLGALAVFWFVGSWWVLAGRASEVGGWGELDIAEFLIIPIVLLGGIIGSIVILFAFGLRNMH